MKILISSYTLDLSGVPTYTRTLYKELKKRGHKVQVFSPMLGSLAASMYTCTDLMCADKPDVIIGQHRDCVATIKDTFPLVPIIFSAHGVEPAGEQPPDKEMNWYTAINEETLGNLVSKGIYPNRTTIIRDFVDMGLFYPMVPVGVKLKKVLFISNRKKWKTHAIINKACEILGLDFKAVGSPYGRAHSVEKDINDADLVIGSGRAILEAMSCGRPVISFDKGVGDGYLKRDTYLDSRTHNFCGELCKYHFTVDDLINEISKYDCVDGEINREIILQEHNVINGVDQIISIIRRLI